MILGVGPARACATAPIHPPPAAGSGVVTVSATPSPMPGSAATITMADGGRTIRLRVGRRVTLHLRDGLIWRVSVDPPAVLRRVPGVATPPGAQGLYQASRAGTAEITAIGDPPCRAAHPACMAPSLLFRTVVVVR